MFIKYCSKVDEVVPLRWVNISLYKIQFVKPPGEHIETTQLNLEWKSPKNSTWQLLEPLGNFITWVQNFISLSRVNLGDLIVNVFKTSALPSKYLTNSSSRISPWNPVISISSRCCNKQAGTDAGSLQSILSNSSSSCSYIGSEKHKCNF